MSLNITCFLIDDDVDDQDIFVLALEDVDPSIKCHVASDGIEALLQLGDGRNFRPDYIFLDLNMPRMNGNEVLAEIKKHPSWKRIPVVVMTSSRDEEDYLKAYDQHVNCCVTKPIDMDKFIEVVRSIEDFWFTVVRLPAA